MEPQHLQLWLRLLLRALPPSPSDSTCAASASMWWSPTTPRASWKAPPFSRAVPSLTLPRTTTLCCSITQAAVPAPTYTVSLTKLTQASPYNNGLGSKLTSVVTFHGVHIHYDRMTLDAPPAPPSRRVTLIGASDTAGFCVDGTPATTDAKRNPWRYDNCDRTSHAVLGRRLEAQVVGVQAIAGIGLTQNAFANMPFLLGKDTMPDYYNRRLQTEKEPLWDFASEEHRPDLVVVSLGGNDFNHQSVVPSNATFQAAYVDFLEQVAAPYASRRAATNHSGERLRPGRPDRTRPRPAQRPVPAVSARAGGDRSL